MSRWGAKQVAIGVVFTALTLVGVGVSVWWQLRPEGGAAQSTSTSQASGGAAASQPVPSAPESYVVLPPWPTPTSLPWVGDEGTDPYGYPLRRVDTIGLQTLLRVRRFGDLERYIAEIVAAYVADPRKERWLTDVYDAFGSSDPRLLPALSAWVEAHPESAIALLARGAHRHASAWRFRGGGSIRSVSAGQLANFEARLAEARADIEAAASRDPRNVQAWVALYTVASEQSDRTGAASALLRAKSECPLCLTPYEAELRLLTPRWGGSYAAMDVVARAAQTRVNDNPALVLLGGYADADRCQTATRAREFAAALAACNRAVASGTSSYFLARRAQLHAAMERYADALADAEAVLRLKPRSEMGLEEAYTAQMALGQYERGAESLLTLLYADPGGATGTALAAHASQTLTAVAHDFGHADRTRALRYLDWALTFQPDNGSAMQLYAWWMHLLVSPENSNRQSIEQVAARAQAEPDSFDAQRDYDIALYVALRRPEIVALWDSYIARHPEDGRAYRERSGAQHNVGNEAGSRADAVRGCELGDGTACRYARR